MKRKILAALLCALTVFAVFAGCSDKSGSSSKASSESEQSEPETKPEKKEPVDAAWFDDAVFVGDSVTLKLNYYCEETPEALSNAQFFCGGSLGFTNALWDINEEGNVHPYYQGRVCLCQDCAKLTGAKKVFIMLGMNDIALYGYDDTLKSARTLVENILKESPGVAVYIQSVTPMIAEMEDEELNNAVIRGFNEKLREFCESIGYTYLDVYGQLADEDGNLKNEYCSDPDAQGKHFTDAACAIWVEYLKENVT